MTKAEEIVNQFVIGYSLCGDDDKCIGSFKQIAELTKAIEDALAQSTDRLKAAESKLEKAVEAMEYLLEGVRVDAVNSWSTDYKIINGGFTQCPIIKMKETLKELA